MLALQVGQYGWSAVHLQGVVIDKAREISRGWIVKGVGSVDLYSLSELMPQLLVVQSDGSSGRTPYRPLPFPRFLSYVELNYLLTETSCVI